MCIPFPVFCADIGSAANYNFGWWGVLPSGESYGDEDMQSMIYAVDAALDQFEKVALGFESPLFVPMRDDPINLTKRRIGEGNRNWIGGPGASVLATGLVQTSYILRRLRNLAARPTSPFFDPVRFLASSGGVLLWEAFVSGAEKAPSGLHVDDARLGVEAFLHALPDIVGRNAIAEPAVLNLLGAVLLHSGWTTDLTVLGEPCVVLRPLVMPVNAFSASDRQTNLPRPRYASMRTDASAVT